MTEDNINRLRQADASIRDAIREEERERPPRPKNLNARLMQRVEREVNAKPSHHTRWPWLVAACIAAILVVYLMPPKGALEGSSKKEIAVATKPSSANQIKAVEEEPQQSIAVRETMPKLQKSSVDNNLIAQAETDKEKKHSEEPKAIESDKTSNGDLAISEKENTKVRTISEKDIPIIHPENLKYTKEELALMKKQANEAYLKWVQLELEIAKYNLEQTAQR